MFDQDFDSSRPLAREVATEPFLSQENIDWLEYIGFKSINIRSSEGAAFTRISDDIFVIAVKGAQPLHDDRHLDYLEDLKGFSHDTWNLVVTPSESQYLLLEVGQGIYETFSLAGSAMIYMNTYNNHAVTRKNKDDIVVIVQADGYGPDQIEEAKKAIKTAADSRQDLGPI